MKKKVVYTCITGDYDEPTIHNFINPDYDYVLFTDNKNLIKFRKSPWEIRPLAYDKSDNIRNARWHKTHPHILFTEYEISVWVDTNINILTKKFFDDFEKSDRNIMVTNHPDRNCIFHECDAVAEFKRDKISSVCRVRNFLKNEKMPYNFGLAETLLMFRRHNKPEIISLDEDWWNMIKNYSYRDQLSFTYILWKHGMSPKDILISNERANPINYKVRGHISKKQGKKEPIFKKICIKGRNRIHIYLFGKKIFSYRSNKSSGMILDCGDYIFFKEQDGIHIRGNGLNILGKSGNTVWTGQAVLCDREYDFNSYGDNFIMIDIGLNIGLTSLWMARKDFIKKIYAFEPFAPTMEQAQENLKRNKKLAEKIKVFAFGLSDREETFSVPYNPNLPGSMSSIKGKNPNTSRMEKIKLKQASKVLRPILDSHPKEKIMLKIDFEGGEREILPDLYASKLLQRASVVIMEYHDHIYEPLMKILKDAGFDAKITEQHDSGVGMIRAEKR